MEKVKLSDNFTYLKLLRFALPSVLMQMVTSIYSIFDGYYISNFAGKTAFAAINLIMPAINILCAFAFVLGTGGSALIAKMLGQGHNEKANEYFSMFVAVTAILGAVLSIVGFVFMKNISILLGANEAILSDCIIYGRICCIANAFYMVQCVLSTFSIVAEKAQLGLINTVVTGVIRVFFDFLFVYVLKMSIWGAGLAMLINNVAGALIPAVYFRRENKSLLKFTRFTFNGEALLKAVTNGSSEMLSMVSMSLVGALYNLQLMKLAAENGVAAYGVIMYVNFIYTSFFFGYAMGINPVVGYNYGAQNTQQLKNVLRKSLVIFTLAGLLMTVLSVVLARPICNIYVGYDPQLLEMSVSGMVIFSFSFLFMGYNILGSAFFTGLNNGLLSAIISFLRTCVLQIICIIVLPIFWGINGMWSAVVVAEILTLFVTGILLIANKNKYGY